MAIWVSMAKHFLKKAADSEKAKSRKCPDCGKQIEPEHFTKEDRAYWRCPKCSHSEAEAK